MSPRHYKHALSLTSQLYFCSIPVRLDSYNNCSFSCGYCFARTRQGFGRTKQLKLASASALDVRLRRIEQGYSGSALDDFLRERIPIQLGGMSDPFSYSESKKRISLDIIKILAKYKYPYVISTKGVILAEDEYLCILKQSNVYVRFSVTVISSQLRQDIDRNCPELVQLYAAAKTLSNSGIATSFRFQPIFPDHENCSYSIVEAAKQIGVKHISAEYLKVPIDANKMFSPSVKRALGGNPIQKYVKMGAKLIGREYILPVSYRARHLLRLRNHVKKAGMTFGFADNDLLLHSDGKSCCSASDLYLKNIGTFASNIVSIAKNKRVGETISLDDFKNKWFPNHSISPYLNSTSRIRLRNRENPDWPEYFKKIWKGTHSVYHPAFFVGIKKSNSKDRNGNFLYKRILTSFDKQPTDSQHGET